MGENGSGKSILLSNIVDAFYEIANKAYTNVSISDGMVTKYYKVLPDVQITPGRPYMIACLRFVSKNEKVEYIIKCGNKSWTSYNTGQFADCSLPDTLKWKQAIGKHKDVVYKEQHVSDNHKSNIEQIFNTNVICYSRLQLVTGAQAAIPLRYYSLWDAVPTVFRFCVIQK